MGNKYVYPLGVFDRMSLVEDAILDQKMPFTTIVIGVMALSVSWFVEDLWFLVWIPIVICGVPIVIGAIIGLFRDHNITADVLVAVALTASVIIGEYDAAAEISIIMQIGSFLEEATVNRANSSISKLIESNPDDACVISSDGSERMVPLQDVVKGDLVRIRPGETIPVDGTIVDGSSSIDCSLLTGESVPVDVSVGDRVSSGTTNMFGSIDVIVEHVGEESTLARMTKMLEESGSNDTPVVRTADIWARYIVVIAFSVSILSYLITSDIYRSVTVLVVFCPCALILATPTAIMAAAGNMSSHGVLVKNASSIETMARADTILLDKTGTVTIGKMELDGFISMNDEYDSEQMGTLVSALESRSEHPIGLALSDSWTSSGIDVTDFTYIPGMGVSGTVDGRVVHAGNEKLMENAGITLTPDVVDVVSKERDDGYTLVLVSIDGSFTGYARLSDSIRSSSIRSISELKEMNIRTRIVTGDCESVSKRIAREVGSDEVSWGCLPEDKLRIVEELSEDRIVCMVGDGINDSLALRRSDVGIAIGGMGNNVSVEAADMVFMEDGISRLPGVIRLSRRTLKTIHVGIAFSILLNSTAMVLAVMGLMGPIAGALVHNIGSVLVIIGAAMLTLYDRW